MDILTHAGIFLYPLALCSLLAVFITFERLLALRPSRVMPTTMVDAFISGQFAGVQGDSHSVAGRIVSRIQIH